MTGKKCPVCGKPMVYNQNKVKNPKAPDWKCSDPNCKYQYDPLQKMWVPSEYVTGVWEDNPRAAAQAKFEAELVQSEKDKRIQEMHKEKTENIARSVALNNATLLMQNKPEIDIATTLKIADAFYEWLKRE